MGPKWGLGSCPVRRGALQWMTTGLASLLPFQSVTPRSHGRGSPGWRGGYPWCLPGCRDSYRLWSHPKSWVDLDRSQSSMLLSLQMSPTEAEGKRCQAHVCTVASWGWSRGGAAVSFVTHNCSSCFALWLFLPLKVQRPCLTTDTSSHLFVGLPSFIPFPTYFGNWLNWVYFSTVTMATTSSHGSRFVIRSM